MKTRTLKKDKVNVITLGCSKNLVDSEVLMGQLRANEFDVAHESDKDDSNIIIVNTCGFIDNAKQESIDTILRYADAKEAGQIDKLYVTGCLSQRYKDSLETEIPELEIRVRQLSQQLNNTLDHIELTEISKQIEEQKNKIDSHTLRWLELIELKEQ